MDNYQLAGYVYESNGEIEIIDISRGIVKARVVRNIGTIGLDNEIAARFPRFKNIDEIATPVRMNAVIVTGYPLENLSGSQGTLVYINRGRRDGVKIGTEKPSADT